MGCSGPKHYGQVMGGGGSGVGLFADFASITTRDAGDKALVEDTGLGWYGTSQGVLVSPGLSGLSLINDGVNDCYIDRQGGDDLTALSARGWAATPGGGGISNDLTFTHTGGAGASATLLFTVPVTVLRVLIYADITVTAGHAWIVPWLQNGGGGTYYRHEVLSGLADIAESRATDGSHPASAQFWVMCDITSADAYSWLWSPQGLVAGGCYGVYGPAGLIKRSSLQAGPSGVGADNAVGVWAKSIDPTTNFQINSLYAWDAT